MQQNQQKTFCSICKNEKSSRFCSHCQKDTPNLYKENLIVAMKTTTSLSGGVKRGDMSRAYFPIAYGILLTLSMGMIQLLEILNWYYRIILIAGTASIFFYLCFFNGRFRNFIVRFFTKSKEFIEKF